MGMAVVVLFWMVFERLCVSVRICDVWIRGEGSLSVIAYHGFVFAHVWITRTDLGGWSVLFPAVVDWGFCWEYVASYAITEAVLCSQLVLEVSLLL